MNNDTIDLIVNEVIKRINLLLNMRKALVIIRENDCNKDLKELISLMKDDSFVFDYIFINDNEIRKEQKEKILKELEFRDKDTQITEINKISSYDTIILSDLKILEIVKLTKLDIENDFLYLIYRFLKEGKLIYSFSKDLEIDNNQGLVRLMTELISKLSELGIKIIIKKTGSVDIDVNIDLKARVVTLENVKGLNKKRIKVNENTIFTNLAKDYIQSNNIEIIRK